MIKHFLLESYWRLYMRKTPRNLTALVLILSLVMVSSFVLGNSVEESISVLFNSINITVNGEAVQSDNILYEGTTYVPLRDVAEILGKEVSWDGETKTAGINEPSEVVEEVEETTEIEESISDYTNVIKSLDSENVKKVIKQNSEADWPKDYQMQNYQIKNQTEAYNDLLVLNLDTEVKEEILDEAYADWKYDFQMVLYSYNNALEDYNEIQSLNLDTEKKKEILQQAEDKWGKDYGMVLYEYKNQLKAYEALDE